MNLSLNILIFILFIIFVIIQYFRKKLPKSPNASFFKNILLLHRGSGTNNPTVPENSIEAVQFAGKFSKIDGIFSPPSSSSLHGWLDGWMVGWLDGWGMGYMNLL
jgi:hypothetical protein